MKSNVNWIYKVFLLSFILSIVFSGISTVIADSFNSIILAIIIIIANTILLNESDITVDTPLKTIESIKDNKKTLYIQLTLFFILTLLIYSIL